LLESIEFSWYAAKIVALREFVITINMKKLYPNLVVAVIEALQSIFQEGYYADKVIARLLKSTPKWGSRDRSFIAESVYEIVRWYRLLYEIRGYEPKNEADWLRLFAIWWVISGNELPDWEEFKSVDVAAVKARHEKLQAERKIRESITDWLDVLGEREIGAEWDDMLRALNEPARVVLRANSLKTNPKELQDKLLNNGIKTGIITDDALLVKKRRNLFATKAFKDGLFEIQDYASQHVAPFLEAEPGMRVVDACAGGGGKSLHLAALMQNKGQIISLDTDGRKLQELRKRARRAGISIIETREIDNNKVIKRLDQSADRVLMDVPCSGLGVLRRNPDAKWKLSPGFIDEVQKIQQEILTSYSRMVKPGGKLVYATCSILPSENEQQVAAFLEQEEIFTLEAERKISPVEGYDGFYMARLERKV